LIPGMQEAALGMSMTSAQVASRLAGTSERISIFKLLTSQRYRGHGLLHRAAGENLGHVGLVFG